MNDSSNGAVGRHRGGGHGPPALPLFPRVAAKALLPDLPAAEAAAFAPDQAERIAALEEQVLDQQDHIESLLEYVADCEWEIEELVRQMRGSEIEKEFGDLISERMPELLGEVDGREERMDELLAVFAEVGESIGGQEFEAVRRVVDDAAIVEIAATLQAMQERYRYSPARGRDYFGSSGGGHYRVSEWNARTGKRTSTVGLFESDPLVIEARRLAEERRMLTEEAIERILGFVIYADE